MIDIANQHSLIETPLDSIVIHDKKYFIDLSFDNVIRFYNLIDPDTLNEEIIVRAFFSLVPDLPHDELSADEIVDLLNYLLDYINYTPYGGQSDVDITGEAVHRDNDGKYYDLEQDAGVIYAAFQMNAGIDLYKELMKPPRERLHWDKFQSLLMAMPENSMFKQIMAIRQREPTKEEVKDADFMISLNRQKKFYELKNSRYDRNSAVENFSNGGE